MKFSNLVSNLLSLNLQVNSDISVEKSIEMCPICCMSNFKSTEDLGAHIEDHFNQKGTFLIFVLCSLITF